MKKTIAVLLFVLTVFVPAAEAQYKSNETGVVYQQPVATVKDGEVVVKIGVDLNSLELRRRQSITLTPMLRSDDGTGRELSFAPVTIAGKGRNKSIQRAIGLGSEHDTAMSIMRDNEHQQFIEMEMSMSLEKWMRGADLVLVEEMSGCSKCKAVCIEKLVESDILPAAFEPIFRPSFEAAPAEPVKIRFAELRGQSNCDVKSTSCPDSCCALTNAPVIRFELGTYKIVENYMSNTAALTEFGKVYDDILANPDFTLHKIYINGYASPEGELSINKALSEKRAKALADFITGKYDIKPEIVECRGLGDNWSGLMCAVIRSDMDNRDEVVGILRDSDDITTRNERLKRVDNGKAYDYMLREIYPSLRCDSYLIEYMVRSYTPEEAAAMMQTKPELLSLEEMYEAAAIYPVGSLEYYEAYATAACYFAKDKSVRNNFAAAGSQSTKTDDALCSLQKCDSPAVLNNRGIVYFMKGDYERAVEYFSRSAQAGNEDAKYNMEQYGRWKAGR